MTTARRSLAVLASLTIAAVALGGCGRPSGPAGREGRAQTIRMIGSTTVLPLGERWQEEFNKRHPEVDIAVSGGGSGTGVKALISGTAEIAMSSRDIKEAEVEQARAAGVTLVEHTVAYDGIAVIVNPANPLKDISLQQLSDIYAGVVRNWSALRVSGLGEIQLISRDSASGTYEVFKEIVVTLEGSEKSRDYAPEALKQTSNQAILTLVSRTKGAIGYVGLGYVDGSVTLLPVSAGKEGEAVFPAAEAVRDGSYPIARKLHLYTNGDPSGPTKEFLDWIKGNEGQAIVGELGFVPAG